MPNKRFAVSFFGAFINMEELQTRLAEAKAKRQRLADMTERAAMLSAKTLVLGECRWQTFITFYRLSFLT